MRLGRRLAVAVCTLVLASGTAGPALAQDPAPTTLQVDAPPQRADTTVAAQVSLAGEDGSPVAGAMVVVERRVDGTWGSPVSLVTDADGRASLDVRLARDADDNLLRASYDGDAGHAASATGPVPLRLEKRSTRLRVGGPGRVVDERRVRVTVRWQTLGGLGVSGPVKIFRRDPGGDWRPAAQVRTGEQGWAAITVRPRVDTRWKARARPLDWVTGDRSGVHRVDNVPPGDPVRLPDGAPRPRIDLPAQPHATGTGPHAVVTRVPDAVWRQMTGRTWHRGCPVGRASLRLLRINYWDYQGYRRRGELVAHADAVGQMAGALKELYRRDLPLRSLYREDRFGWSDRLHGADDYRSMAAGNSSAFNCRGVVGRPSTLSPHSYGRSFDVNTWENPYRSAQGTVPNEWWMSHSHARVAWRSTAHAVVQVMTRHGLRWTYGTGDTQHFDAGGGPARMVSRWSLCGGVVCD
jgi:hypothetical protein